MTVQPLPVAIASGRLRPLKPRAWVVAACADVLQRQGKAPTRAAITAASGLSRVTVWRACAELRRAGLLHP